MQKLFWKDFLGFRSLLGIFFFQQSQNLHIQQQEISRAMLARVSGVLLEFDSVRRHDEKNVSKVPIREWDRVFPKRRAVSFKP